MSAPILSIITVNYRSAEALQRLLNSFETLHDPPPTEWIVVDNSPEDVPPVQSLKFPEILRHFKIIVNSRNTGFGAGCNLGAASAAGTVLLFLNPDCQFSGGSLSALLQRLVNDERVGALGPKLVDSNGRIEFSWSSFPGIFSEAKLKCEKWLTARSEILRRSIEMRFAHARPVDWLSGGSLFIRRAAFEAIGGFDSGFFLYFEDADLCWRLANAGLVNYFDPSLTIIHQRGESMKKDPAATETYYRQSQIRYYQKHNHPLSRMALRLYLRLVGRFPEQE